MTRNKNRRTKSKNKSETLALVPVVNRMVQKPPAQQRVLPRRTRRSRRSKLTRKIAPAISQAGVDFLKCAFASPDFSVDPGQGIPDNYNGRVVPIKDALTSSLDFTAGKDTYLLIAPIPGYSYFKCEVDPGMPPDSFVGVDYTTAETNFGRIARTLNFAKFRYASMSAGLYPTSNSMQFSGGISCWKIDLSLLDLVNDTPVSDTVTIANNVTRRITGLEAIVAQAPRDNYSASFIYGVYTAAVDNTEFKWSDFQSAHYYDNNNDPTGEDQTRTITWNNNFPLRGLGNMQAIVIKVNTPTGAINTAMLKTWACMECQVKTDSTLYQFAKVSPAYDETALTLYRSIANSLPVACTAAENRGTWAKIRSIISGTLTVASLTLPGVGGMVAAGANGVFNLASGLAELVI